MTRHLPRLILGVKYKPSHLTLIPPIFPDAVEIGSYRTPVVQLAVCLTPNFLATLTNSSPYLNSLANLAHLLVIMESHPVRGK